MKIPFMGEFLLIPFVVYCIHMLIHYFSGPDDREK